MTEIWNSGGRHVAKGTQEYRVCRRCKGEKPPSARRLCAACLPVASTRTRTYDYCTECKKEKPRNSQRYCLGCNDVKKAKELAWRRRRRDTVLAHYGGKCVCCGEERRPFLQIDHIEGGGTQHVKAIGGNFILWLLRHKLPPGFRVLCANCNAAIKTEPHCPHNPAIRTERKVIPITSTTLGD